MVRPTESGSPDISRIARMTTAELVAAWHELTGKPPGNRTSRELLMYALAWQVQADKDRGLSPAARRKLRALAQAQQAGKARSTMRGAAPRLRPGTTLVKQWRGRVHTAMVLEDGFAFEGRTYASLSEIARTIAGTRWNGPAFFGLRKGHGQQAQVVGRGK